MKGEWRIGLGRALRRKQRDDPPAGGGAGFRDSARPGVGGRLFIVLFGLPFFAMGSLFMWVGGLQPLLRSLSSGSWPQVPCRIVSSEVERHADSDGDTFSIEITFAYRYQGRDYSGGSYNFANAGSSGRSGKQAVVDRYPVGMETACYVNPRRPEIAVLSRSVPSIVFFAIPFSSIFVVVGGAFILGGLGLIPKRWSERVVSRHRRVADEDLGRTALAAAAGGPLGKLFGISFVCVFWNGIVGVFLWQVAKGFRDGDPHWFLTVFLIPFVLVGLLMIVGVFHQLLALFNPKVRLSLDRGSPRLGQRATLYWELRGATGRLEDLEVTLEGREEATYRRGTDSVTDRSLFHRGELLRLAGPPATRSGEAALTVPQDLMHSFNGGNNKILWQIRVHGSIRRWPDVDETFVVAIRPRKRPDGGNPS